MAEARDKRVSRPTPSMTEQDAAAYDAHVVPRYSAVFAQMILDATPRGARLRVLDVGCGSGIPSLPLLSRLEAQSRIVAIDRDQALIDIARRRALSDDGRRIFFKCEPAAPLRFGDEVFDLVVGNLVLGSLDPGPALAEMRRVLAPGGRILLTQALAGSFEEILDMLREVALRTDASALSARVEQLAARYPAAKDLVARAFASGFVDATVREESFKLSFASPRELFKDAVVSAVAMGEWRWAAGFEAGGSAVLEQVERALDVYFAGGPLSLGVKAGLLSARRP